MLVQTYTEGKDYVVSVYYTIPGDTVRRWWPLRKFYCQGNAIVYRLVDVPQLSDLQIRMLIRNYDPKKVYRREKGGKRFTRLYR